MRRWTSIVLVLALAEVSEADVQSGYTWNFMRDAETAIAELAHIGRRLQ